MTTGAVKLITGLAGGAAPKAPILSKAGLKSAAGKLKTGGKILSLAHDGGLLKSAHHAPRVTAELRRQDAREV